VNVNSYSTVRYSRLDKIAVGMNCHYMCHTKNSIQCSCCANG